MHACDARASALMLVVDDTAMVRTLMARALAQAGHQVLAASCAEHALELVAERGEQLDLAVIDVHLAGTDGPTLAGVLRRGDPGLPVLFVSGYGDAEQRETLGVGDYLLAKPFDLDTLARCVQELLARGRSESGQDGCACAS
jgi:two-component system, cell cycle sensor histidine kinase and response regulator CckA